VASALADADDVVAGSSPSSAVVEVSPPTEAPVPVEPEESNPHPPSSAAMPNHPPRVIPFILTARPGSRPLRAISRPFLSCLATNTAAERDQNRPSVAISRASSARL
jgi:hypothetical protein